jgi:uncharacterized protein (TIGR00725 family)
MEAACRGFRRGRDELGRHRALAIGVLPTETSDFANDYVDMVIPTGFGWARNAIIVRMANAVISIAGCSGTLSEIALAWQMGRPLVAMAGSGGWSEKLAGESLDGRREDRIMVAESPAKALSMIESRLKEEQQG